MEIRSIVIKYNMADGDVNVLFATSLCYILENLGYQCTKHSIDLWGTNDFDVDAVIYIQGISRYYPKPWNYNILLSMQTDVLTIENEEASIEVEGKFYDAVHVGFNFKKAVLDFLKDVAKSSEIIENRIKVAKEKFLDAKLCTTGPLVSILMGTYNRRKYLPRALDSIVNQTYQNWELCLVQDGGDEVDDIVESYNDPRIKLINLTKNKGLGHGFNLGFEKSSGEYIAYLGDDDVFLPQHIEKLMRTIRNIPNISLVYSDAAKIVVETDSLGNENIISRDVIYAQQVNVGQLLEFNYITGISTLHERALYIKAGGFDPKLRVLIDFDMWRRMACYAYPYHLSAVTAEYYTHKSRQEPHISDIYFDDNKLYAINKMKIIFKKLPIEENEVYKNALELIRKKLLFYFYINCKHISIAAKRTEAVKIYNKRIEKYYVKDYSMQLAYSQSLLVSHEYAKVLEIYRDISDDIVIQPKEMFMALYCALELEDEYAFTIFNMLSENKENMNEQELNMFKDSSLKMKKVFRKRYYEWYGKIN